MNQEGRRCYRTEYDTYILYSQHTVVHISTRIAECSHRAIPLKVPDVWCAGLSLYTFALYQYAIVRQNITCEHNVKMNVMHACAGCMHNFSFVSGLASSLIDSSSGTRNVGQPGSIQEFDIRSTSIYSATSNTLMLVKCVTRVYVYIIYGLRA